MLQNAGVESPADTAALVPLLHDKNRWLAIAALETLGLQGRDAGESVPEILKRLAALEALGLAAGAGPAALTALQHGLAASRLLEREDLDCRPCSRNGKRPCHRGDLACLVRITPDEAWRTLGEMPGWEDA